MGVSSVGHYAGGHFEPEVSHTFLPGCACGTPHPLAIKSVSNKTKCPTCGAPAGEPGPTITQMGSFGWDPRMLLGRGLMAAGRFFGRLGNG